MTVLSTQNPLKSCLQPASPLPSLDTLVHHTMYFNTRVLIFPALFVTNGVLAQLSAVTTSYTPDVTYTVVDGKQDSFVFCSDQNCSGTCEVVNSEYAPPDDGHDAPNDMGYLSMYWYNPEDTDGLDLYTCLSASECTADVQIGPNTCYNLYDNGVPTYFYDYFYFNVGGYEFLLWIFIR